MKMLDMHTPQGLPRDLPVVIGAVTVLHNIVLQSDHVAPEEKEFPKPDPKYPNLNHPVAPDDPLTAATQKSCLQKTWSRGVKN